MVVEGIWYDIAKTQQELYPVWRLVRLGILHISWACTILRPHCIGGLSVLQQLCCLLFSSLSKHIVFLRIHTAVKDSYWSNHLTGLLVRDDHCTSIQPARNLTFSLQEDELRSLSQLLGGSREWITHNSAMMYYKAHGGQCCDDRRILLISANDLQQTTYTIIEREMIYISWFKKKTDCKVIIFYHSPTFGGVRCGCECRTPTQYPWCSKWPPGEASSGCIWICVQWPFLEYGLHSVETC